MKALVILLTVAVMIGGIVMGVAASKPTDTPPNLVDLCDKIDTLTGKVDVIGADLLAVSGDVTSLAADVATLESDVADIKAELANVPRMETLSGYDRMAEMGGKVVVEQTYPEIRHVSLTINAWWLQKSDPPLEGVLLYIESWWPPMVWGAWEYNVGPGPQNVEFDASHWSLVISCGEDGDVEVAYSATVTYCAS